MARLTRAEQQERTHQQLLAAGRAIFARQGFLTVTVEEIAAEAGYTRGAVYKHFGGKEGLWQALAAEYAEGHVRWLAGGLERANSRDELVAALIPYGALDNAEFARWIVASAEYLATVAAQPEQAAAVAAAQRRHNDRVAELLTRHCDRLGIHPAVPVPDLVVAIGSLGAGLALRRTVEPDIDIAAIAVAVLNALLPA